MKRSADVLRIGVDARLTSGTSGGVEQVIIGLASGLSKLSDGDEEYLFLTQAGADEWIRPYVQGSCRVLQGPSPPQQPKWKQSLKSAPAIRSVWSNLSPLAGRRSVSIPVSQGVAEDAGVEVMHFPKQDGFLTNVPSIYHPWDLQHLHLPQFFSPRDRLVREVMYRTLCEQARMVSVASTWGKHDLIHHYKLPEEKVQVVPMAPVLSAYPTPDSDELSAICGKFSLPDAFVYYPAQTWAHKNHIVLLEALAILRDRHQLKVPLVSSGRRNEFFPKIMRRARELRLTDQIWFVDFVSPLEVQSLYELCRCMVFPSKFEGWGLPIMEAFSAGAAVACSNVTSLPEQAGDAALIFDPDSPEEIADAIRRLWSEAELRETLIERGKRNVSLFTWDHTARTFRAHYRRLADRPLTEEDHVLLAESP